MTPLKKGVRNEGGRMVLHSLSRLITKQKVEEEEDEEEKKPSFFENAPDDECNNN